MDTTLQALVRCLGNSLPLYNRVMHYLRVLFVNGNNTMFCALRADILMAMHDATVEVLLYIIREAFVRMCVVAKGRSAVSSCCLLFLLWFLLMYIITGH
jgi:hypothetical protein